MGSKPDRGQRRVVDFCQRGEQRSHREIVELGGGPKIQHQRPTRAGCHRVSDPPCFWYVKNLSDSNPQHVTLLGESKFSHLGPWVCGKLNETLGHAKSASVPMPVGRDREPARSVGEHAALRRWVSSAPQRFGTEHRRSLLQGWVDQPVADSADRFEVIPRRAQLLPQPIDVSIDGASFE